MTSGVTARPMPFLRGVASALTFFAFGLLVQAEPRAQEPASIEAARAQRNRLTSGSARSFDELEELIYGWKMKEAAPLIERYVADNPGDPRGLYLQSMRAFFEGDYTLAGDMMDQALNVGGKNPYWSQTREIIGNTREVVSGYESHKSPKGRFEVFIEPGRDRVLLPYALEALDVAYDELGKELGIYPPTPIRVEVYPSTSTLAKVSSLTEENIRTSGTIALCKYNRLMITSPKALMRGYGWVDTLVHEYVHYAINVKAQDRVPIWMHEGMAKYLERRWRGENQERLPPSSEHLLAERVDKNDLITFEQMHPSMAKLPSQEDAAVAFAEVYTVMEYLRATHGEGAFSKVLDNINDGHEAPEAFAMVLGTTFPKFERVWKKYLKERPRVDFPDEDLYEEKLRFEDEGSADVSDLKQIPKPAARDHVHLGEMLMARKRFGAAVAEFDKAVVLMGDTHPIVQTRLAQSLRQIGEPKRAYEALQKVRDAYPSYVVTWHELGRAAHAMGKHEEAKEALLEAIRINPFDPAIHEDLAMVLDALGDKDGAKRERDLAKLVS